MLLQLFITFFKIGCFTIGGGYAMVPVIQREIVENKKWISEDEFLDAIALTNSLPGPLATNTATYVGYRMAGIIGAITGVLATALPSFLIILAIAILFTSIKDSLVIQNIFSGIRPAVVSLIIFAVIKLAKAIGLKSKNLIISLGTLFGIIFLNIHPIVAVIISAVLGFFFFREEAKEQ
ncbi:MAG: chromate transporter [Clostridiales bacterium]|nr:chromate transporter [Clostridiales bacterium]